MTDIEETARAELIQRLREAGGIEKLHEAARIERAETIRKLLRKLLHRERQSRFQVSGFRFQRPPTLGSET